MGNDGATAMTKLRSEGGRTIAESEDTAIVWGMPGELVKAGGAEVDRAVATRSPRIFRTGRDEQARLPRT